MGDVWAWAVISFCLGMDVGLVLVWRFQRAYQRIIKSYQDMLREVSRRG